MLAAPWRRVRSIYPHRSQSRWRVSRMTAFPIPDPITPDWLTDALQGAGVLPQGRVVEVHIRPSPAFNSRTAFLELRYSADAPASAPTRLVCKQNLATAGGGELGAY